MPRKDRVLKQKKTVLKRAAEDHGQTKLTFSKIPRNDSDSPKKSGSAAVSLGENSIDQVAQRKETDDNDAHGQSISDEHDTSSGSNKDSPSTEVVVGTVEEDVSNQQQGIKRAHDLADLVPGKKSLTDLTDEATLKPIFERLTNKNLLEKCLKGLTQNANESFNNLIWNRCPKGSFCGKIRIVSAVAESVAVFKCGASAKVSIIQASGIKDIGANSLFSLRKADCVRLS